MDTLPEFFLFFIHVKHMQSREYSAVTLVFHQILGKEQDMQISVWKNANCSLNYIHIHTLTQGGRKAFTHTHTHLHASMHTHTYMGWVEGIHTHTHTHKKNMNYMHTHKHTHTHTHKEFWYRNLETAHLLSFLSLCEQTQTDLSHTRMLSTHHSCFMQLYLTHETNWTPN